MLTGGTLIDGQGGPPLRDAVIVIEGDRVTGVGAKATPYPADAVVHDLSGKFIIPGLVESHVHNAPWMGELFLNQGGTTIMAIGGNFGDSKELSQQPDARMTRLFGTAGDPRLSPSMGQEQVRENIREWLKGSPDFARLRNYNERSHQVYQWAAEEIHRAGLLVFGHTEDAAGSIGAGQDIVEHLWGFALSAMSSEEREDFQQGTYLHWGIFLKDTPRLDEMIADAVARGVYINPTLFFELGSPPRLVDRHELETHQVYSDPQLMAYYPRNISDSLVHQIRPFRNFFSKYADLVLPTHVSGQEREEFESAIRLAGEFLRRFVAAGGKVQAGTDTPSGGTPGLSLHHEMELLVEAGLSPMQALQSATLWSGEILSGKGGVRGQPSVGLIAKGAFADLVVLTANPLEDIANTKKIDRVMKGGQFIKLGFDPAYFTFSSPPRKVAMASPVPAISAISPHTVTEESESFDLVVEGAGFMGSSLVQVNGVSLPTTFVEPRRLKARVPADIVRTAEPQYFGAHGPPQRTGVMADRIIPIYGLHPSSGSGGIEQGVPES